MKIVGLIVEYNPFHLGHLYHIEQTKHLLNPNLIIAVMSGNFTQRGDIAIIDKFKRAEIALKHGVDLVIELPYPYATSSADRFSEGAIKLLHHLNVTDITFGSETNDPKKLQQLAKAIDSPSFDEQVKQLLKKGYSYPKATEEALKEHVPMINDIDANDTLGIQYIRQIMKQAPHIDYHTIKRINNRYSDANLTVGGISSATSIRKAFQRGEDVQSYVPTETLKALEEGIHTWEDFYPYLRYQVLARGDDLSLIHDMNEGLDQRIKKAVIETSNMSDLLNRLTSKRHTESKMKRLLCHILTQYTEDEFTNFKDYIRILGLRKEKSPFVKQLLKDCELPVITNVTRTSYSLLKTEMRVDQIYYLPTKQGNRKIPIII